MKTMCGFHLEMRWKERKAKQSKAKQSKAKQSKAIEACMLWAVLALGGRGSRA